MASLSDHTAVIQHGSGVYSEDLADFTRKLADIAATRIATVGDEQYNDAIELQKFEREPIDQYVNELVEEVADIFAYASIIVLKAIALKRSIDEGTA